MLKSNIKTAVTRYGELSYYADDLFIGHSLEVLGEYSQLEIEFLAKLIKPGWKVIDVGANIGTLTAAFSDLVGNNGEVIAFEPQPENYNLLDRNMESRTNVHTYPTALGEEDGEIMAPPLATIANRNYGAVEFRGNCEFGDKVPLARLDHVVHQDVNLIKIDVEGMEPEVIRGAKDLIARCRPILYVENDRAANSAVLLQILADSNYQCYSHRPQMYNPDNFNRVPPSDRFNYVSLNLLALPSERLGEYQDLITQLTASTNPRKSVTKTGWAAFARYGGVGDNLVAASVCKPLKDMGYKVEVISQGPIARLFENNPFIDKLSVYDEGDLPKDPVDWHAWHTLRAKEYDKFVNLSHSGEMRHAAFRAQTSFWWPASVRRKIFAGSYLETAHDLMEVPHKFGHKLFWPTADEMAAAWEIRERIGGKPVIGWCINGTRIDKLYPQAPQLIGRLIKELDARVVIVGRGPGTKDFEIASQIEEMVKAQNGSAMNLFHIGRGDLPLRTALAVLQECDLVVGPDTGTMWAVAMERLPKIVLLSHAAADAITKHWVNTVTLHADPKRVDCWPCHRLHDTSDTCRINQFGNGAACISDISADSVIDHARQLLGGDNHA